MREIFSPLLAIDSALADSTTPMQLFFDRPPQSAYLHIPFCRRRCYYCDFPVSVVGDRSSGDNSGTIGQYVEILLQEISITPVFCQPLETIFFGGGTPSLLSVNQLGQILEAIARRFGIASGAEISIEIDPGTFTAKQLSGYRDAGVNRVSMGVQAFQDELLKICGRSHAVSDIYAAADAIHFVGMQNFSIDLISGLPHQTLDLWQASLEAAVALSPTHISTYDLIVEAKTAFSRYYQPGVQPMPSDETAAQMYRQAQLFLTRAGYEHYEISNYAQPGYQCRHNRVYWENRPYYGFGMGAASNLHGHRFTRPRKTREYYEWVRSRSTLADADASSTSEKDFLLETLMLGLRLREGLSLATLAALFGHECVQQIWTCLQPYHQQAWVEIVGTDLVPVAIPPAQKLPINGQLRLSDPEGFLFSNTILATLFSELG